MQFELDDAIQVLERTPYVLRSQLRNLDESWVMKNEGENTFSPFDVVGHLVHGDKTDWLQGVDIILSDSKDKTFQPFDRFAQFSESHGKSMIQLLDEFENLRCKNLQLLKVKNIGADKLNRTGIHPAFGKVTLRQLLATWTVHDLGHIAQINRVMAKQYKTEVGPWIEYLGVLTRY